LLYNRVYTGELRHAARGLADERGGEEGGKEYAGMAL